MPEASAVTSWLYHTGFGFITPEARGEEHFVHCSEVKMAEEGFASLISGEEVEYEVQSDPRKPGNSSPSRSPPAVSLE